jgi:nitronate monooxygenase
MGLKSPVVNAPMGGAAGGRLATAVSRAGGLGMIGMGSAATADLLVRELAELDDYAGPFGIGLVHWVMTDEPGLLDAALVARPALLSVSFGDEASEATGNGTEASEATGNGTEASEATGNGAAWDWVRRAHGAGVTVATQVATIDDARRAEDAGVDVLVARGAEGGGHGRPAMGTLPLLVGVLDTVDVPVLAAGGVSSARGLAAVLAAGASGAWIGTMFAACTEALTPDAACAELLSGSETELTSEFDIAAGYPWPGGIPERVLRGSSVNAGQGVGLVRARADAAEIVEQLSRDAATLLGRWGQTR